MNNKRFNIGNIRKKREYFKMVYKLLCGCIVALYFKGKYRSAAVREIFVVKTLLLAARKRRMIYLFNLRMIVEVFNYL